ncbi:MAG: hypothetical protein R2856_15915 [Caldilineaceae bacterium]
MTVLVPTPPRTPRAREWRRSSADLSLDRFITASMRIINSVGSAGLTT